MAKGERRRRRQLLEEAGLASPEFGDEHGNEAGTSSTFTEPLASETSSSAPASTDEAPPEASSESDTTSAAPRPIALAEILAKPRTAPRNPGPRRQRALLARTQQEEQPAAQSDQASLAAPAEPPAEPARDPFFASPAERLTPTPEQTTESETADTGPQF